MTKPRVEIRAATGDDVDAVASLLAERDERSIDAADVRRAFAAFDPAVFRMWLALVDDRPRGMTSYFRRRIAIDGAEHGFGYWGNLYIAPDSRNLMLYPRLVLGMLKEARADDCDAFGCVMRRGAVTEAHLKMGFAEAGSFPVRARPLRPFTALGRHKGIGVLDGPLGGLLDGAFGAILVRRAAGVREVDVVHALERAAQPGDERAAPRVAFARDADAMRTRFAGTIDGAGYAGLVTSDDRAGAVVRLAERDGLRLGVVLLAAGADRSALASVLRGAAGWAHAGGAHALIALESAGGLTAADLAAAGIRRVIEHYRLILSPKDALERLPAIADTVHWRFDLADHDAF